MRLLYVAAGLTCVGIGTIGYIVPGLPGTVFFLCAAWCFGRSSPRLERWLLNLPGVGRLIDDYRNGLGMPRRAKWAAITSIIAACTLSVVFGSMPDWVRVAIVVLGAIGVWYVGRRVPTTENVIAEQRANVAA